MFNNDWNVAKNKSGRVLLDKCFAIKDYVEALSILCHIKPGQARPGHTIHLNLLKIINQPNLVQHPVDYVRVMFDRLRIRLAINRINLLLLNIIINIGQIFSLLSSKLHVHYSNCSSLFMIVFHLS